MTGKSPKPPPGTGVNGGKLWRDVLDAYELEEHELALLREAVRTVDQLDDLHLDLPRNRGGMHYEE